MDVFIAVDNTIEECQCECAAGEGPTAHCKHIIALLLALETFFNTGLSNNYYRLFRRI